LSKIAIDQTVAAKPKAFAPAAAIFCMLTGECYLQYISTAFWSACHWDVTVGVSLRLQR